MSRSQREARDAIIREQILEHLGDVVQSLLAPAGDTAGLYVRPPPAKTTPGQLLTPAVDMCGQHKSEQAMIDLITSCSVSPTHSPD